MITGIKAPCGLAPVLAAPRLSCPRANVQRRTAVCALGDKDEKKGPTITRESEPDEYWGSKFEKPGANPIKDPIAIIGLAGILFPFLLLGIFIATGVIDINK